MAKRKVKKAVKQQQQPESNVIEAESIPQAPTGNKDDDDDGALKEVEHQIDAIRSIRYLGIERLRTELRLLHSYFKEEQLQTPLLQFFETNLPNISLRKENDAPFEVQWKQDQPSLNHVHGSNIHASLLHQISSYPNFSATVPSFQGYEHSSQAVKTSLPGVNDLQIGDSVLEELSRTQMFGYHDALQTPGASSQRMSFGMTPKTTRLPKKGEMILSVHGSPLGVFKEDNMELDAISGTCPVYFKSSIPF